MARGTGSSYRARNSITRFSPVSSRKAADSSMAFLAVMPLTVCSRSGSSSITARVSVPKRSTSRWAVAGPMPLRMPEAR